MTKINAGRLADALADEGIVHAFGLMGNGNLEVISELVGRLGLCYLPAAHESGAVAAADGYARASGRTGLALLTHGPGLTNAATAIVTARRAASPIVVVAGDASANPGRSTQRMDQERFARSLEVPIVTARADGDWAGAARAAVAEAQQSGCVLLNLPAAASGAAAPEAPLPPSSAQQAWPSANREDLDAACVALASAERPLVLSGRGVVRSATGREAAELAIRLGAPYGTSLGARGLSAGATGDIGLVGGLGSADSQAACNECDLIVALGASLNGFTTENATLFRGARVVRLDLVALGQTSIPVDVALTGHLRRTLPDLLAAMPVESRLRWRHERPAAARAVIDWPSRVFGALDRALPEDRCLTFDHGDMANAAVPFLRANEANQHLFMPDFGSLGLAVAAAVGAATARPDRLGCAIVGDGGMTMSLPDLDMLARSGLPVLVVVMNDRAFGAEIAHLRRLGAPLAPATFPKRRLGPIARAMGLEVSVVAEADGTDEVARAVARARSGPVLLEVLCDPPTP